MKMSWCCDWSTVMEAKRDHEFHYPHQTVWRWRDGYALVCFRSQHEYDKAVDRLGGFLRLKAEVHKALGEVLSQLC